jgi:cysteine synthase B
MGAGRFLKQQKPSLRVVAAEPGIGHKIQGLKNMTEAIVPGIYRRSEIDDVERIEDEEAFETARTLALTEGLFVGMSSGAAMAVALRMARRMEGGTVAVILPDRGDRYLSTSLFRSVCGNCPP